MFCRKCGKEMPDGAEYCNHCGAKNPHAKKDMNNSKGNKDNVNSNANANEADDNKIKIVSIIAVVIIILAILIVSATLVVFNMDNDNDSPFNLIGSPENSNENVDNSNTDDNSVNGNAKDNSNAEEISSTSEPTGSWQLIGSFSGSGSGSKSISVPAGQIRIEISAYPIKNYATNHLTISGTNGESAGVYWGSTSAVATRSDSVSFTSSSPTNFDINYYETVSWKVNVYKYQ